MSGAWKAGDRLTHRLNAELGPGRVVAVDGRTLVVDFPSVEETLRLAADSDVLAPLVLRPGAAVRHLPSGRPETVVRRAGPGRVLLGNGTEVEEEELWPIEPGTELLGRLAAGEVASLEAFALRLDALRLVELREADGLGSFLGGRIRLFPHQLYVAERATRSHPVRWLLADEVGLGKTVESCLILNHLLRTGRAERTLVVAPETLTVQWLGELWRKYHQVFVLLDRERLQDVARDYGQGFNPFDAHHRVVIARESLEASTRLTEQAVEAGIDLLVVDEAHHLRRRPGHPGTSTYRAVAPIAAAARHLLLLTAVPLEDDVHGFFRLLELLLPEEFADPGGFETRLASGTALPPCTSATRRVDIGGMPPRVGAPVDLPADEAATAQERLVEALRRRPATSPVAERDRAALVWRALASPAIVRRQLEPKAEDELLGLAAAAAHRDPRVDWLVAQAESWHEAGEKTLLFVAERESLDLLRAAMRRRTHLRIGLFHEQLSTKQRDIEVAQFRLPQGPSLLISTECGGEGRNFEFCTRLVLFDLPWRPMVVEQRIGRLDRIGRSLPIEIVYFRPPHGLGATVARLYERLGLFERPLGSFETELRGVEAAIEELALHPDRASSGAGTPQPERFEEILVEAQRAHQRVERAAYHELHRDPYRAELAAGILARVPAELDELTREVVVSACRELGLVVEESRAGRRHWIELDAGARVESLPGIGSEASFLGSFWREEALADETIDYFAAGHPLVEGILEHLSEDALGRVALLQLPGGGDDGGFGLFAVYRQGTRFVAVATDAEGRERSDWCERLTRRPRHWRRVRPADWVEQASWPQLIRQLGRHLEGRGSPVALAAVRIG